MKKVIEAVLSYGKQNQILINRLINSLQKRYGNFIGSNSVCWSIGKTDADYYGIDFALAVDLSLGKPYIATYNKTTYILAPVTGKISEDGVRIDYYGTSKSAIGLEDELLGYIKRFVDPNSFWGVNEDNPLVKDFEKSAGLTEIKVLPSDSDIRNNEVYKKLLKLEKSLIGTDVVLTLASDVCTSLTIRENVLPLAWINSKGELNYPWRRLGSSMSNMSRSVRSTVDLDDLIENPNILGNISDYIISRVPGNLWLKVKLDTTHFKIITFR